MTRIFNRLDSPLGEDIIKKENMIRIYTSKNCDYCEKLKEGLNNENYEYVEIDIDNEKNEDEVQQVFEFTGVAMVPTVIKKPHLFVPTKSFNTIDQLMTLIKSNN